MNIKKKMMALALVEISIPLYDFTIHGVNLSVSL